jgi:urease accessory protein
MTPSQFVHTLQLMDSFFPVGAFAYSDGLETAAATGDVCDAQSLANWLDHYINAVFVPCDGLALFKCARAIRRSDWPTVRSIDEELTAIKPSAEVRASSIAVGRRLLGMYASLRGGELRIFIEGLPRCNAPVAYGIALSHVGLEDGELMLAYGHSRITGIISSALRLIPIGQQQGQTLLAQAVDNLPAAVECVLGMETEPLRSFAPFMDIQQMNHQYVYSRLFKS